MQQPHTALPKHLWVPSKWLDEQTPPARAVVETFLNNVASQLDMQLFDYPVDDKLDKLGWKPFGAKSDLDSTPRDTPVQRLESDRTALHV